MDEHDPPPMTSDPWFGLGPWPADDEQPSAQVRGHDPTDVVWNSGRRPRGRSARSILVVSVLPWLVVAGGLVTFVLRGEGGIAASPAQVAASHPAVAPTVPGTVETALDTASSMAPDPSSTEAEPPHALVPAGPATAADDVDHDRETFDAAASAAAAIAVRDAVTAGEDPAVDRYPDLIVPERTWHAGEFTVVALAVVVLEGTGGRWERAVVERYAVPIATDGGVRVPAGPAWRLPPLDAQREPISWETVEDPDLERQAGEALERAGYRGVVIDRIARAAELPGVVRVTGAATPPGSIHSGAAEVWLTSGPDMRLLGEAP